MAYYNLENNIYYEKWSALYYECKSFETKGFFLEQQKYARQIANNGWITNDKHDIEF